MKRLGVNTVRIYNTNPTTLEYTTEVLAGIQTPIVGQIVGPSNGKDHRPFMDAAQDAGLMVVFALLGDATLMKNTAIDLYERWLVNQIDEVGNHPALLMYTLGNELNLAGDANLLALVNHYIGFAKNYSMTKWGRSIPITHAIVDNPSTYDNLFANLNVDVFTSNAGYRGLGFSDLWSGSQVVNFSGLGVLSQRYNKPNFIGEFGWEQINGSQTADPINAGWFNLKWKDLIIKGTPVGCVGGSFFEYMDEPYSKSDPNQQSMGVVSVRVSTQADVSSPGFSTIPLYTRQTSQIGTSQQETFTMDPSSQQPTSQGVTQQPTSQGVATSVGVSQATSVGVSQATSVGVTGTQAQSSVYVGAAAGLSLCAFLPLLLLAL